MTFDRRKAARQLLSSDILFEIVEWVLTMADDAEFSLKDLEGALPHLTNTSRFVSRLVEYAALERNEREPNRPKFRRRADSELWAGWRNFATAFDRLQNPEPPAQDSEGPNALRVFSQRSHS
jgi:hypothetical protein